MGEDKSKITVWECECSLCGQRWEEYDVLDIDGYRAATIKEGACRHWQPGSPNSPGNRAAPSPTTSTPTMGQPTGQELVGDIVLTGEEPA